MPPKAKSIVTHSKAEILSCKIKKLSKAIRNMFELRIRENIPSGISIVEAAKKKETRVPPKLLRNRIQRYRFGTELQMVSSLRVIFMMTIHETKLNAERKKANSKIVTPRLVRRSFVKMCMTDVSKAQKLTRRNTFLRDISDDFFP